MEFYPSGLIVSGGLTRNNEGMATVRSVELIDVWNNRHFQLPHLPYGRFDHTQVSTLN